MAKITIQTDTIINTEAELYDDLQKALNGLHNPEDERTFTDPYLRELVEESGIYLKAAFDAMLDEIEEVLKESRKSEFAKSERRNPDLVQKEVQVIRENKTFTRKQWVRPEEIQEQHKTKTLSKQELSDFIRAYDRAKKENTSAAMGLLKENGIHWEESKDPAKNWENANAVMIQAKNMIIEKRGLTPEVYSILGLDFPDENDILNVETGALDPYSARADIHAERYYESVRHMTTDVDRISKNTGWETKKIQQIKEHIFIKKHHLSDGYKRFDPDFDMAQSWQRLIDGKNIKPCDILLLNHEFMELTLMKEGHGQIEAHRITNRTYNYQAALQEDEYGKNK